MAVANARTFDSALRAIGMGVAGYAKPNNAQTANIKNIPAKGHSVYLDSFMTGDNMSIAKLETSTRKRGKKKSKVNSIAGVGGYVRHITIRSNGSSKIIGAAIAPTMALPKATQNPLRLARYAITRKVITPEVSVMGVIGFPGPVK
jgi:hypothetical protein